MNYDKGAEYVFGFTDKFDVECWEFKNNTSDACNFLGPVPEIWVDDFEARYPEETTAIERFKEMHNWVVSTKDNLEKFKMEFEDHFDMHFCLIYYVYTFFALMVDQRAKNMFLTYWGETGKWQPFFYDNDTSFGINNEGQLVLDYYYEDTDQLEGANVYNGQNSVLWCNFRDAFPDKIKETYQDLRSNGVLNYDELIYQFITKGSDKWSESIYNEDADFKYISMLYSDNDASNLEQVRGTGEEHFRYFVENRLNYCDSKWYAKSYADDYVAVRIYTPNTWSGVEPNANITVTPYSHMYAAVRYKANGTLYQKRVDSGVPVTFTPKGEIFESENNETFNDTETGIYGASQLSSLGDLSPLYCGSLNVSKATKLTELIVGSNAEGYSNPNLKTLAVGTNNLLKVLNVRNCPNLAVPLALAGCPNIEEIYAGGSGITGVELASSGYLKILELPATVSNLTLKNQLYIESLTLEGYSAIKTINIENCPTVSSLDILSAATNVERVRLTKVDWSYDTAAEMLALAERNIAGIDENGVNTDKMWIDGKCHIKALSGAEYLKVKEAFPYIEITYDSLTAKLTYMSEDGSTKLYEETIVNGGDGGYSGDIPTKPSTAQYDYVFGGWSLNPNGSPNPDALKNVEADRTVYVAYNSTLRKYTVKFYNGTTLLETKTVDYGSDATYSGSTPVHPTAPDDCEFRAWKPEPTNIQGDTNCYAQWYDRREITDDWATIAQACLDGTATDKYAIGAFKMLDIGVKDLPIEFGNGSAVLYNNEIHILGSSASAYRTSHYKWTGTEWVEVSTLPYEFYYGSAVVFNGEIHILGGSGSSSGKKKHYKWNGSEWVSVSTLPYMFRNGVAVVYNNEIHIMGSEESSYYTSHYKWNGSSWSEVGELPYSLYTASAVIYNNELHVLGSYDSNHDTSHYKWNGSTWTSVSTLPQKLSNGHALVVGTDIYMIQWDEFYKYDGTSWSTVPEVPANVYEGCSVVLDGVIYVMGSSISENRKVFFSYTPETETWSKVGITESIPMEVIAHNHDELADGVGKWEGIAKPTNIPQYGCAVTYQNEVHALGGNSSSSYTQHIKWDDTNSTWVTVSALPYQFRSGCAVILNDEIHILGSYQTTNKTEHYKWNATDGWVSVSTLPYSFYCSSAVVLNNEIHILGSYDSSSRKYHYKWNGTEWASVSTLPYNFYYGSAVVYNGEIHIFSGSGSSTGHYKWDGSAWTSVSTLPYNLQYGVATIINNEIHIFGGSDNETGHYKWDGTEWTSMTTLPGGFNNYPLAVCNGTPYIFISTSCYKLAGPSWESGSTSRITSWDNIAVVYNNEIHVIGRTSHTKLDDATWVSVSTAPYNTTYGSVCVYNSELHILGGNGNQTGHYKWDGTTWGEVSTLPYNFVNGNAVVYNNELHILGGNSNQTGHYKWNGTEWSSVSTLPYSSYSSGAACIYYNEIHILGGQSSIDAFKHYKWNGTEWSSVSTLPYSFYQGKAVVLDNGIHILGGNGNTTGHYKFDSTNSSWVDVSTTPITSVESCVIFKNHLHIIKRLYHYVYTNPRATLTFLAKNVLKEPRNMSSSNTGTWNDDHSILRPWLNNEFIISLPSDLRDSILDVKKLYNLGSDIRVSDDKCFVPSANEVGVSNDNVVYTGEAYSVFTNSASRIRRTVDGTTRVYWLRDKYIANDTSTCSVKTWGDVSTTDTNNGIHYVLPGFCI